MTRSLRSESRPVAVGDNRSYMPTPQRPVRGKEVRPLEQDVHFEPHQHPWAQLAYCASGLIQVTVAHSGEHPGGRETTYIVPPSRAVWIAPGVQHAIAVMEAAQLRTLYLDPSVTPPGWATSRVLVVSPLLRELIVALELIQAPAREAHLSALVQDELTRASTQALGVPLPDPRHGDKRLRALCEAVLRAPGERATLAQWLSDVGASERTIARLFQQELGMSYPQWRQQAVLAHALPMLARGLPVSQVAAANGYASDSAFSAMFKAAMGQSPSHFQNRNPP